MSNEDEPEMTGDQKISAEEVKAKTIYKHLAALEKNESFQWFLDLIKKESSSAEVSMHECGRELIAEKRDIWKAIRRISKLPESLKKDADKMISNINIDKERTLP